MFCVRLFRKSQSVQFVSWVISLKPTLKRRKRKERKEKGESERNQFGVEIEIFGLVSLSVRRVCSQEKV